MKSQVRWFSVHRKFLLPPTHPTQLLWEMFQRGWPWLLVEGRGSERDKGHLKPDLDQQHAGVRAVIAGDRVIDLAAVWALAALGLEQH